MKMGPRREGACAMTSGGEARSTRTGQKEAGSRTPACSRTSDFSPRSGLSPLKKELC